MTFCRSIAVILFACFLSVGLVDIPDADAASKRKIKKYRKCLEANQPKCTEIYLDCPDKQRDRELQKLASGKISQPEFMDIMDTVDQKCFQALDRCNDGVDKVCQQHLR